MASSSLHLLQDAVRLASEGDEARGKPRRLVRELLGRLVQVALGRPEERLHQTCSQPVSHDGRKEGGVIQFVATTTAA
jgi:hypothetical protein